MSEIPLDRTILGAENDFDPEEPGVVLFHALRRRLGMAVWAGLEQRDGATQRRYIDVAESETWELPPSDTLRVIEGRPAYDQGSKAFAVVLRHPAAHLPLFEIGDLGLSERQVQALEDEGFPTGETDKIAEEWREIELAAYEGQGLKIQLIMNVVPAAMAAMEEKVEAQMIRHDSISPASPALLHIAGRVSGLPMAV